MSVYALGEALRVPSSSSELGSVRDWFPTLTRRINGRPLVYLDSAATSQKPDAVIDAEARFYRVNNAAVHRGVHTLGTESTQAYEDARTEVAGWLHAPTPESVIFTRNATSALNLVARGWEHNLRPGDEILVTEMEHHANLVPWMMLAKRRKLTVRVLPFDDQGRLDLDRLPSLLNSRTRVVALTHVSNVLGTINPVAEIADRARRIGALVVVDAAQAVGHMPVDFAATGADLLVFSAHKTYGPTGLGALIGRPNILERLEPVEGGGEMIARVDFDEVTWAPIPHRFEAGTANVAAAAAFPEAIRILRHLGAESIRHHEEQLVEYAWERLQGVGGLQLLGPADPTDRGGLISFHDPEIHPHDLAQLLDQRGVAVRAGHHCAQPLHRKLGLPATTRASFGVYSTHDDVDALIDGLRYARSYFS